MNLCVRKLQIRNGLDGAAFEYRQGQQILLFFITSRQALRHNNYRGSFPGLTQHAATTPNL